MQANFHTAPYAHAAGIAFLAVSLVSFGCLPCNALLLSFAYPIFFLLAGFFAQPDCTLRDHLDAAFNKLMLPYTIAGAAAIGLQCVKTACAPEFSLERLTQVAREELIALFAGAGARTQILGAETQTAVGVLWLLPALFFGGLFARLLLQAFSGWVTRFGAAALLALVSWTAAHYIWLPFSLQSALFSAFFILLGRYAAEKDLPAKLNGKTAAGIFAALCVPAVYGLAARNYRIGMLDLESLQMEDPLLTTAISVGVCVLVFWFSAQCKRMRGLQWLGENAVGLLCVHFVLCKIADGLLLRLFVEKAAVSTPIPSVVRMLLLAFCHLAAAIPLVLLWNAYRAKRSRKPEAEPVAAPAIGKTRDRTVDMFRAVLILLMMLGHENIDNFFSGCIYSFHMMAFVLLSGYFQKEIVVPQTLSFGGRLQMWLRFVRKFAAKFLLPYGLFGVMYILLQHRGIWEEIKILLLGMSRGNLFFTDVSSTGPIYFVLMLFVCKVLYMALAIFVRRTGARFVWMIGLSLLGVLLGRFGVWLPWSTDCALYALIFFGIGMLLRKYQMFAYCQAHPYICFLLAPIWLYFVQSGAMELVRRHYNLYGLGVIGAVCGTLVVYTVVALTASRLPNWLQKFTSLLGQATMYILMVHTLSVSRIELFLETQLGLQRDNLPNFLLATVLQLVVAIPVFLLTQKLQAYFAAKKSKKIKA